MNWTDDATRLIEEFEKHPILGLDSVRLQAGETWLSGGGTLQRLKGRFFLTARFSVGSVPPGFGQTQIDRMQTPHLSSRKDFWPLEATTSSGIRFQGEVAPPHGWKDRSDGVTEVQCSLDRFMLSPGLLDGNDLRLFEHLLDVVNSDAFAKGQAVDFSLEPSEPISSEFHAILPGVKCVLADRYTEIVRKSAYLPEAKSSKLDTFVIENDDSSIALIENDENLHVYLKLPPGNRSGKHEVSLFSALMDAVAFISGCQPFPLLKECRKGGRVVCCEISAVDRLDAAEIAPISERMVLLNSDTRNMLQIAFEFFKGEQAIVSRIRKLMWLYREAGRKEVPLPVQVLTACTLFEGLVQGLFDANGLKRTTLKSDESETFNTSKDATIKWLMAQHDQAGLGAEDESPWRRFAAYLKNCGYLTPKERMAALSEKFGFAWENDIKEVYTIWKRHRHELAHGAEAGTDYDSIAELFQAWSRISGAIHRFILAEMGYVGHFCYSPMEAGLETLELKARP